MATSNADTTSTAEIQADHINGASESQKPDESIKNPLIVDTTTPEAIAANHPNEAREPQTLEAPKMIQINVEGPSGETTQASLANGASEAPEVHNPNELITESPPLNQTHGSPNNSGVVTYPAFKTHLPLVVDTQLPNSAPAPSGTSHVADITATQCLENLNAFIDGIKPGLRRFYTISQLNEISVVAAKMINSLRKLGCGKEASTELSILCLYDLVILIDDSLSMKDEQGGNRIKILRETIKQITTVYDLANEKGILSVKFINALQGFKNVTNKKVRGVLRNHPFWGTTRIGTALEKRVIDELVFHRMMPTVKMTRPLLIMTVTDGEPEGEPEDHLLNVIKGCVKELEEPGGLGKDAVAFHFSRVGDDKGAKALLAKLDNSCPSVDCLRAEYALEKLKDNESKWGILSKLLLGAIISSLNQDDDELKDKKAQEHAPVQGESFEDKELEDDVEGDEDD